MTYLKQIFRNEQIMDKKESMRLIHIISHPNRFPILKTLSQYPELFGREIAIKNNLPERLTAINLNILAKNNILTWKFGTAKTTKKFVKFYTLNPAYKKIIDIILDFLEQYD